MIHFMTDIAAVALMVYPIGYFFRLVHLLWITSRRNAKKGLRSGRLTSDEYFFLPFLWPYDAYLSIKHFISE